MLFYNALFCWFHNQFILRSFKVWMVLGLPFSTHIESRSKAIRLIAQRAGGPEGNSMPY